MQGAAEPCTHHTVELWCRSRLGAACQAKAVSNPAGPSLHVSHPLTLARAQMKGAEEERDTRTRIT